MAGKLGGMFSLGSEVLANCHLHFLSTLICRQKQGPTSVSPVPIATLVSLSLTPSVTPVKYILGDGMPALSSTPEDLPGHPINGVSEDLSARDPLPGVALRHPGLCLPKFHPSHQDTPCMEHPRIT